MLSSVKINQLQPGQFDRYQGFYRDTRVTVEASIDKMFDLSATVTGDLFTTVIAVATIYIALMGYALMSGWMTMTPRDAGVKFSKVVLIIVLLNYFSRFGPDLYEAVWRVPESLGNYLVARLNPALNVAAWFGLFVDFDTVMDVYASGVSNLAGDVHQEQTALPNSSVSLSLIVWGVMMAPIFVITISILIAKMISAVLFMLAPVVFILSLLGLQNNYLASWFKGIFLTFLTVIIVYMIAALTLTMMAAPLLTELALRPDLSDPYSLPDFTELGILSIFTVVLVSQATTIASAIMGVAAINTQQATGFLQIGALQGASRVT